MSWFISHYGDRITTIQRVLSETIPFVFLVLHDDVNKLCNATSDPSEHGFFVVG